jgi:hypothetical protein
MRWQPKVFVFTPETRKRRKQERYALFAPVLTGL